MDGDISLAGAHRFRIPSSMRRKFKVMCSLSWRSAAPGHPRPMIAASLGNFSGDGVSQTMGLHLSDMAHAYHDAGYDVTAIAASWTPSPYAAEEGMSTTS
jgi:hypothetical protein